jgi:transforming growth factor-beta-induced protein
LTRAVKEGVKFMKYSFCIGLFVSSAMMGAALSQAQQVCPLTGQPISAPAAKAAAADKTIVETAIGAADLSTLVAAVKQGQLVETLSGKGPFTVFAPINSAFAKLPKETLESLLKDENRSDLQGILTYHVVSGKVMAADVVKLKSAKSVQGSDIKIAVKDGKVYVNDAQVIKTDIVCSNGVVHLIDSVILPPSLPNIVETAVGNEDFSTLVALVKHAGLVETLSGEGPFTVFAPSNAAFAKLPKETVDALLSDAGKDQLASILKYHVVPGKVMAADAVKLTEAKTALGQAAKISLRDGKAFIDGAQIVATDIECSNGVIHVIDSVILPQSK